MERPLRVSGALREQAADFLLKLERLYSSPFTLQEY
jgi:hypothetical protein